MQKGAEAIRVVRPTSFFARAAEQGTNYSTLVGWLLHGVFKGRTWKLIIATTLSLVHFGSQAAAIYAVYWYAKQMDQTGHVLVPYLNIEVNLKDQPEWLWAIVIFSTACFVLSAGFLFLSRQQVLDIIEKHYAKSLEQLVLQGQRLPDPRAKLASQLFADYGVGGLNTGCRRGALIATAFANAIVAVIGGTVAAIVLFRIDTPLTLLILIAAILGALLLYPLALRAVKSAKYREKAQLAFKQETRALAQRPSSQAVESLESVDDVARAFLMRQRTNTELIFAIEIGITVILAVVIYYMATQALTGREQWAVFIAYIGALRITLSGASQAIRAFASVSRYYPPIVRYYLFTKDVQKIDALPFAKVQWGDTVILGTLKNGKDVVVKVGDVLALATFESLQEVKFALLGAKVPHSIAPLETTIVDPATVSSNDAAVALLAADVQDEEGQQRLRTLLESSLKDKVTLRVYHHADKVGAFGEKHVLTIVADEFLRFAALGTQEGDAVLKEFALMAVAERPRKRGLVDSDDENEDDDI